MKYNFRILILLLISCVSDFSLAHDESLATVHIRRSDGGQWQFEIMAPLHALDHAMRAAVLTSKADESLPVAGSNAYKEAIAAYVKDGFEVYASGRNSAGQLLESVSLSLGAGRLRLDDHVSLLLFEINGMPAVVEQLEFTLAYMAENPNQNNFLRLIHGKQSKRYILNSQNHFSSVDRGFFNGQK